MLCHTGVESIKRKNISSCDNAQSFNRYATHNCTFPPAQRAIAPVRIHYAIRQVQLKHYGATVARRAMRGLDGGSAYLSKCGP
jgi:hypothetical protein